MGAAGPLQGLARFGRLLRDAGLEVGPRRLQTAAHGLDVMGLASRETVYWTLRCTLVSRREEGGAFDAAFAAFWDAPLPPSAGQDPAADAAEQRQAAGDRAAAVALPVPAGKADGAGGEEEAEDVELGTSWSAAERLRHVDFSTYGPEELAAARAVMQDISSAAPRRRSRRLAPAGGGPELDRRRTLGAAMRTGGHPVERRWREQRVVPRRLVFLIDVSGSMEGYARALVLFAQTVLRAVPKVEVYTFGTRLTRLTRVLGERDALRALADAGRAIPDWAGGTRIGDSLEAFNRTAGRRGMTRGAVVTIVSDGCERGDPELLGAEMARLRRAAHTVVWVNPLAGDPRYEPRTQGMVAALPCIDVLLPGHDLASLEALAAILDAIPPRRVRRAMPA